MPYASKQLCAVIVGIIRVIHDFCLLGADSGPVGEI